MTMVSLIVSYIRNWSDLRNSV